VLSGPRIALAALDLAGTLVADDGVVEGAFADALAELGFEPTPEQQRVVLETMGQSKIVVFRRLLGDEAAAQRASTAFEDAYARRVARGEVGPLPGAADALAALRDAGVRLCLTTGFSDHTRAALVEHLGWTSAVDLQLSPGPGIRGRPYPDLVLTALLRLGIDDVRAVAVAGDTVNDLWSGWRAGAGVVAGVLTGAHDRATLAQVPHTHLLDTIADLVPVVLGDTG
jgi:phosphonatase-like hydrolase